MAAMANKAIILIDVLIWINTFFTMLISNNPFSLHSLFAFYMILFFLQSDSWGIIVYYLFYFLIYLQFVSIYSFFLHVYFRKDFSFCTDIFFYFLFKIFYQSLKKICSLKFLHAIISFNNTLWIDFFPLLP